MANDERPDWPPKGYLTREESNARIQRLYRRLVEAVEQWGENPPEGLAEAFAAADTLEEAERLISEWIAPLQDEINLIEASEREDLHRAHGDPDGDDSGE